MMNLPLWVEENKLFIGLFVVGLVVMGFGVWRMGIHSPVESNVEIVAIETATVSATSTTTKRLIVDISGAVEQPGVYELPDTARINDALVVAGGLSKEADTNYVARFINLAAQVTDGAKLYIPFKGEFQEPLAQMSQTQFGNNAQAGANSLGAAMGVNINTASVTELESLWGIGEKRAQDIIASRPYSNVQELLTKAKIPSNVFDKIKDQVSVY